MVDIVILAAGKGKRMNTIIPKALVPINNKAMIKILLENVKELEGINNILIVVGFKKQSIMNELGDSYTYCYQDKQLGTANALLSSFKKLTINNDNLICLFSDMPFVDKEILSKLINVHVNNSNDITIITNVIDNPKGYGRIINEGNKFKIVEEINLKNDEININEINTGILIGKKNIIYSLLNNVKCDEKTNEYYLTSIFNYTENYKVGKITFYNDNRLVGFNDLQSIKLYENKSVE